MPCPSSARGHAEAVPTRSVRSTISPIRYPPSDVPGSRSTRSAISHGVESSEMSTVPLCPQHVPLPPPEGCILLSRAEFTIDWLRPASAAALSSPPSLPPRPPGTEGELSIGSGAGGRVPTTVARRWRLYSILIQRCCPAGPGLLRDGQRGIADPCVPHHHWSPPHAANVFTDWTHG